MHCKQVGSAILKISLFEFNSNTSVMKICSVVHYFLLSFNGTNICDLIISLTYVVITCFCVSWAMSYLRVFVANQGLSRILAFLDVLSRLLLRH